MTPTTLQNAVVTGASAGLGREIVRQLALDRDMTVLATARRQDRLEALAAELPEGRVRILAGDLADAEFRRHLWRTAEAMPGGVDLLVNNAGIGHYAEFAHQDFDVVARIFEVNVLALADLTQRAASHMKARGSGQILQISSVLGFVGLPYSTAYVASKHAVNGLVTALRYELRGTGVRVWAACPARTESEFSRIALDDPTAMGSMPKGESTAKVVRGILDGLDRREAFVFPTWTPWTIVKLSRWLPGPFDWVLSRWAARHVRRELERAKGPVRS
ncbi:MAG: SDR family NAD(P)-dependent oxidoreductase [Isosphaeraceae bacterium]